MYSISAAQSQGDKKYWIDREPIRPEANTEAKGLYEKTQKTPSTVPEAQKHKNGEPCTIISLHLSYDLLRIRHQQHGC